MLRTYLEMAIWSFEGATAGLPSSVFSRQFTLHCWRGQQWHTISKHVLRLFAVLFTLVFFGCTASDAPPPRPPAQNSVITPEAARDAIVKLIADNPDLFIGKPDPAKLKELALVDLGNNKWQFGAFTISLDKMTYTATIGENSIEPYLYDGNLHVQDNNVIATAPTLTRYHKRNESR